MDNFPQFPPRDPDDTPYRAVSEAAESLAWLGVIVSAWVLALLGIGYWIADAAPIAGSYIHGVLLGMLLGIALMLATLTTRRQNLG